MTRVAEIPATYRAEFASVSDLDGIALQASLDQAAGIPVTRGRERYTETAERAHYLNAWMASMKTNGPAKRA